MVQLHQVCVRPVNRRGGKAEPTWLGCVILDGIIAR